MDDIVLARALHVLAVVHWIGGVAFVTLVVLPLATNRPAAQEGSSCSRPWSGASPAQVRFQFRSPAASGLWMTYRMDLWDRFADPHFWWMSAMAGLWLVFALMVFVLEPLLHRRFERQAKETPAVLRRVAASMWSC